MDLNLLIFTAHKNNKMKSSTNISAYTVFKIIFEVINKWPFDQTANLLSPASINQRTDCDQYRVETWTFLWPYQPTANVY